ncbi:MAG TPA: arginase family protein [Candidatus Limnocylindria bacterium]|nr:arginase family protein [Candidatus Limnocylindria bacterium]
MAVPASPATFLDLPATDPGSVRGGVAILGVPHGVRYPDGAGTGSDEAPLAIRSGSRRLAPFIGHHDFDTGGAMLSNAERVVDCGDVSGDPADGLGNAARAEATVRSLLERDATPIVLGGDDSIAIPVLAAFDGHGPLTVLQVDAHLDFRHEVAGVTHGYSSPMRRASEMAHVERVAQVGLRGVGSARPRDVEDAQAAGGLLVTARELRERGVAWMLDQLPTDASVFIAFDLDGLDPSLCPAVNAPVPGGLSWDEAGDLLSGAAARCHIVGAAFTELAPDRDPTGASAVVAARLVIRLLSAIP